VIAEKVSIMLLKIRHPFILGIALIFALFFFPILANKALSFARPFIGNEAIAPLFTRQVQYWGDDIERWGVLYDIDPNLIATIMQIESCGHPSVVSRAGAQGLFQVMPFHFSNGENMLEPETNAFRSASFIKECYNYTNGDVGLVMACYNGGPSLTSRSFDTWPNETQRYYVWGLGIYIDAMNFSRESDTLSEWLTAGGSGLCNMAAVALGVP
jgi:soluble lytic murein transglycosylase-like protein